MTQAEGAGPITAALVRRSRCDQALVASALAGRIGGVAEIPEAAAGFHQRLAPSYAHIGEETVIQAREFTARAVCRPHGAEQSAEPPGRTDAAGLRYRISQSSVIYVFHRNE